jgi:hypothetical protein
MTDSRKAYLPSVCRATGRPLIRTKVHRCQACRLCRDALWLADPPRTVAVFIRLADKSEGNGIAQQHLER